MSNFSASSYADAIRLMKANPGRVFTWDAGDGWKSEGRYDPKLRRNVIISINPKGGAGLMTHFERTSHEVATQARESIAAGLGMTEFFAWAAGFVMGQRGHSYEECEAIILPAWENAFDEARDAELAA